MSNHSIGTLAALFIFGCLLNITSITLTPGFSHAQMSELSDIQSGIFHLSHNNPGIDAETFANDQYVDDDQANIFASASRTEPFTPADDNYPFYLVDHYVLDSDLVIVYDYKSTGCSAYPKAACLSRHNISYADYTNRKSPPDAFFNVIKGTNPYTGEKATAIYMKVTDYEVTVPEMCTKGVKSSWGFTQGEDCAEEKACTFGPCACLPKSDIIPREECTPTEDCYSGWVYNTYVRVDSASVAVWTRTSDTDLMKRCAPVTQVSSCLPPSAVRRAPIQPKVNSCLPPSAIRSRTIPVSTCANRMAGLVVPSRSQSSETPKTNSVSITLCRT